MQPKTIIGLLFPPALLILCISSQTPANSFNSNSIVKDNIEYYLQTDKAVYETGEIVQILYGVTNLGSGAVTFRFTCGPVTDRCDFMVEKDGHRIWDNLGRPATLALTSFTLDPAGSNSFTILWDMTDANDNQITAGDYEVTAVLNSLYLSDDKYVPVSVTITIIPTTLLVPDDYPTIQQAIDAAVDGDIIIVQPGLYDEDIYFLGKNITLTGVCPLDISTVRSTIIGRAYPDEALIVFRGTEDANCTLKGFEINGSIIGFDWLIYPDGESHTNATISHSILENNGGGSGNVIFGCDGLITDCVVAGNNNRSMLPIDVPAIDQCLGVIRNCTVVYNLSTGIGIESFGSPVQLAIENCVVYGNAQNLVPQISVVADSTVHITYSNIYGGLDGVEIIGGTVNWGPGNIDADPCFVEEGYWQLNGLPTFFEGDYHLLADSPCIDAGDPNYIPEPNETDLDGNPRIVNDRIDMGAYEFELLPAIEAVVKISPNTLNLQSKGKRIMCLIRLPEDYSVSDIDPNSILLEDEMPADRVWLQDEFAVAKFSRSALQELLADLQTPTTVELLVSGQLNDETPFEGTDTIRVINKGNMCRRRANSNSKVVDDIEYYIQTEKAVYHSGENVQMLYRVTNLGDQEVSLWFPHSPVYNFWVAKDGQDIWQAVNGWWDVITTLVLAPGESKEFPDYYPPQIWDMRDRDGNLVSPGKYTVTGGLYAGSGLWDFTRVSVRIRIVSDHVIRKELRVDPGTIRPIDKPRKNPARRAILRRKP